MISHQDDHLKAVLFGFAAGQELSGHIASMPAIKHFHSGETDATLGPDRVNVTAGSWIYMLAQLQHIMGAKAPVAMLLILLKQGAATTWSIAFFSGPDDFMERTRAALWGIAATIILGAMIMAGSRNLAHFDAALVGYTVATLFAVFGITYRYAMWLQRPPTWRYWVRGWQLLDSQEFGDLMRQLVPEFHVYLVRLIDGGHLLPRARVQLNLATCMSDLLLVPELAERLTRAITLDLFVPPQRERIREEAVRLAAPSHQLHQREIADELGCTQSEPTFQVVVQRALALDRMMKERELTSPYTIVLEPPTDYNKLRRHRNARYDMSSNHWTATSVRRLTNR
jgi:hypothetical protein